MDSTSAIGLDFETYSACDLRKHGLENYVTDPTFRVTLAALAFFDRTVHIDFVNDKNPIDHLRGELDRFGISGLVVAHNSAFEERVLKQLGVEHPPIYDSAVTAASAGASRHLAGAAKQLLDTNKLDGDGALIGRFALPQKDQVDPYFDTSLPGRYPNAWLDFIRYCRLDAELSRSLFLRYTREKEDWREQRYAQLTRRMNATGWPVDVPLVEQMQAQYLENRGRTLQHFADNVDKELNLNSSVQLMEWAEKRGVKSSSFDKAHVDKLLHKLGAKVDSRVATDKEEQVLHALRTKKALGGSSLSKLQVILNMQSDGRLYDQYLHVGAPGSHRTSGRGVQMQNLPRLGQRILDPEDENWPVEVWTNDELSENMRQVFRASHPNGLLFVADFSSIESRGLALLAGEEWKLRAYQHGRGIYEELAARRFSVPVDQVTKEQRTFGKVGELSCGYQAGSGAVKDFAETMGVMLTETDAADLVHDWRQACPHTVALWDALDEGLRKLLIHGGSATIPVGAGLFVHFSQIDTPLSLLEMHPTAQSVQMSLTKEGDVILSRVFHGCYLTPNGMGFYKPSELKTGDPWKKMYTNPKTGRRQRYNLYGGRLTGILVQSFCREIFFERLQRVYDTLEGFANVRIVGQFHDEFVLEWEPGDLSASKLEHTLIQLLSWTSLVEDMPMAVEVKSAQRYIK